MKKDSGTELSLNNNYDKDDISNKEIGKKIFTYAVPFIVINIVSSCYNFIDMTLLLRTMNYLDLDTHTIEFAASSVTTWAPKINMIVASIAMGMSTSLIPTMVSAYTLGDWKEVNGKFNQALQIILFVSLPMTIGISLLSNSIWSIFYGYNPSGSIILAVNVFTGLLINIYMTVSSSLQGLNKFKAVYLTTIIGFALNALLDAPLIILYNKIGIPCYLGAVSASIIGYATSILIALYCLKKDCKMKYKETIKVLAKTLIPLGAMAIVVILLKNVIPVNYLSKLSCIIYVGVVSILGAIVYFVIAFKMKLVEKVLGKRTANAIIKKLTFGKISI